MCIRDRENGDDDDDDNEGGDDDHDEDTADEDDRDVGDAAAAKDYEEDYNDNDVHHDDNISPIRLLASNLARGHKSDSISH